MKNPFSLKVVTEPEHFCNRTKEINRLISFAESDTNAVIYSPRRFGKTSLVYKVQKGLQKSGYMTIYVDLFGMSSAENISRRITSGVYTAIYKQKSLLQKAISIIKTHRPVLRPDDTGISISAECVRPNLSGIELLDETLCELGEFIAARKKQVNIALDEFQEITEIRGNDIEGVLRSNIQNQRASYFFVGSRRRVLLGMFNQRRRPFFQSAVNFELEKLPHGELKAFIEQRFDAGGKHCSQKMAALIANRVDDHPYYCQKLGFFCFELCGKALTQADVQNALAELIEGERPVFEAIVQGLSPSQIALLRAVAKEPSRSIMSMDYTKKHNLKSIGGIQSAAKKLEELDHIERAVSGKESRWIVVDPLFARWLAQ